MTAHDPDLLPGRRLPAHLYQREPYLRNFSRGGYILTVTGSMFVGKTAAIVAAGREQREAGVPVLFAKPTRDTRGADAGHADVITMHNRDEQPPDIRPRHPRELYEQVLAWLQGLPKAALALGAPHPMLILDEAQFLAFDSEGGELGRERWSHTALAVALRKLARNRLEILAATLTTMHDGRPWPGVGALLCEADEIITIPGTCERCTLQGSSRSARRDPAAQEAVKVGGAEAYMGLCRGCFEDRLQAAAASAGAEVGDG